MLQYDRNKNSGGSDLKKQVAFLESKQRIASDPRLAYFTGIVGSKNGSHKTATNYHKAKQYRCALCGSCDQSKLTMAHLISEVSKDDAETACLNFNCFGPPTYPDQLDTKSARNFMYLCGTKGQRGSCHDMFDNFRIGLLYDPLNQDFVLFCVDEIHPLNGNRIRFEGDFLPYRRLLAWRMRRTLSLHLGSLASRSTSSICDVIDCSEQSSSVVGKCDKAAGDCDEDSSASGFDADAV